MRFPRSLQVDASSSTPRRFGAEPTPRSAGGAVPREKLNVKFLLVLVGAIVLAGGSFCGLHAFQKQRMTPALRDCAEREKAAGRLDRAVKFMALYLAQEPSDLEARITYAGLLSEISGTPQARQRLLPVYAEILQQDPQRREIRRRLIGVAMETEQLDQAIEHLQILRQDSSEDGELDDLLADCCARKKDDTRALELYQQCLDRLPTRIETYLKLARLLRNRLASPGEADDWLEKMIEANKQSFAAYLGRAHFRCAHARDAEAESDVAKALELAPDEPQVLLLAARLAQAHPDQRDKARGYLQRLLEIHPEEPRAYRMMASLETQLQRPKEALRWLRQGLQRLPDDPDLLWDLTYLLIEQRDPGAHEMVAQIGKRQLLPGRVSFLQASLALQEGKWLQASKTLQTTRPLLADSRSLGIQTDLLLAQCYEKLGDYSNVLLSYRRVLKEDQLHLGARLGVIATLLAQGRLDSALVECQNLMDLDQPPATGWALLARLRLLETLHLPPGQRQWDKVEATLERAAKAQPDSEEVRILQAEVLVAKNKLSEARKRLQAARQEFPRQVAYPIVLAELAARERHEDEALRLLDDADKLFEKRVELALTRVKILTNRGGEESLRSLGQLIEKVEMFPEKDQARLLSSLASAHLRLGKTAVARGLWQRVAELLPTDLGSRLVLFDLAHQEEDEPAMRESLTAMRQIEGPGGPLTSFNEARLLVRAAKKGDTSRLAEARDLLAGVGRQRSQWSRVPLVLAEIDELDKNTNGAIENYLRAIDLGERQPGVVRRAVELLFERKRYAQADLVLRKVPDEEPVFGDLNRLAAQVSLQVNDVGRALNYAGRAVPATSKNPADHRWLGQLLAAAGQLVEAEAAFRQALKLSATDADSWVAFVQFLTRTGQKAKAETAVKEARDNLPAQGAELALGQCYAAVNRIEEARAQYRAARQAKPNDVTVLESCADFALRTGRPDEADECLRQIIDIGEPAAAKRARDVRPVVLAAAGDPQKTRQALALMDLDDKGVKVPEQEMSSERLRSRAVVLAAEGSRKNQEKAIGILELLDQRQPLAAEELFLLAQLYERTGQPQWRDMMHRLLAAEGANPRYLAYQVRVLLRQGLHSEAEKWLDALQTAAPKALQTLELKARLLAAKGKGTEAATLLKAEAPAREPQVRIMLAGLMEELGQGREAAELYRQYAAESKEPARVLVLARYLGRQGQVDEALRLCEEAWRTCPAESVGFATLAVLHTTRPRKAQYEGAGRLLETALAKQPRSSGLLVCLADLADLRGRHAEAERLYREVLAHNPKNAEALNNLAWLLALQAGHEEEALRLINQALEILGPAPELLDTRALVYLARRQTGAARTDLQSAADKKPSRQTLASIQFHLARAYQLEGKQTEAIKAAQAARKAGLDPSILHPLERPAWDALPSKEG